MLRQVWPEDRKLDVVLVERNPLVADALRRRLERSPGCNILSESMVAQQPVDAIQPIFIVDDNVSVPSLLHRLRVICHRFPQSKRIALTEMFLTEDIFSLLLEGVHGFVTYRRVPDEIHQCLAAVSSGRLWLARKQLEEVCFYLQSVWASKSDNALRFTKRQKEIIDLLRRRLSNKEIASYLCISHNTVKFHIGKVFTKLGVRDRQSINEILKMTGT